LGKMMMKAYKEIEIGKGPLRLENFLQKPTADFLASRLAGDL
jgi:hypothetical protein